MDFCPGLIGDFVLPWVIVRLRRGFNVEEASESSSSESSELLEDESFDLAAPEILAEERFTKDDGGRRPADDPGERASWENEGTGELAALRRACASRKAATEIRCDESDAKLPSRGRGRTGGRMETESLGDSGRT